MDKKVSWAIAVCFSIITFPPSKAAAQNVALLLFDGETGTEFVGCLNCGAYDSKSVCNRYGEYGSRYSDTSIWNRYGRFGSRYENNSPWNRHGEGLRVVDPDGNYYGRFTKATFGRSRLPLIEAIVSVHDQTDSLEDVRDLLCE